MNKVITILLLFISAFGIIYTVAAYRSVPNWDEEASYDIAFGLRPSYTKDSNGLFSAQVPYAAIGDASVFSSADYEQRNKLPAVMQSTVNDNSNSVIYYIVLHYVMKLTGSGIFYLKLFSVIIALLNLLFMYRIGSKLLVVPLMPLCLVILFACNPIFFQSAILIRSYSLALLFSLAAADLLLAGIAANQISARRMFLISLLAALAFLANYFSLALLAGLVLCLWYAIRKNKGLLRNKWSIIASSVLIFVVITGQWLLLAYPEGIDNLRTISRGWLVETAQNGYSLSLANFGKQVSNSGAYLLGFDYSLIPLPRMLAQGIAGACLVGVLIIFLRCRHSCINTRLVYAFLMLAAAFGVYIFAALASGHFLIFEAHYQIFLLPFFSISLLGIFDYGLINAPSRIVTGVLLGILIGINAFVVYAHLNMPAGAGLSVGEANSSTISSDLKGFQEAGRFIKSNAAQGSQVVYPTWKVAQHTNYFLRTRTDLRQSVRFSSQRPAIEFINKVGDTVSIHITE